MQFHIEYFHISFKQNKFYHTLNSKIFISIKFCLFNVYLKLTAYVKMPTQLSLFCLYDAYVFVTLFASRHTPGVERIAQENRFPLLAIM